MSNTGLDVFDTTLQKTNIWLNEIMRELGWTEKRQAYHALRSVLHVLRDRLPTQEVVHLGSQLPLLIMGIYYEGWKPSLKRLKDSHKVSFLDHLGDFYPMDSRVDLQEIARIVFKVVKHQISRGESEEIGKILPAEMGEFWAKAA